MQLSSAGHMWQFRCACGTAIWAHQHTTELALVMLVIIVAVLPFPAVGPWVMLVMACFKYHTVQVSMQLSCRCVSTPANPTQKHHSAYDDVARDDAEVAVQQGCFVECV